MLAEKEVERLSSIMLQFAAAPLDVSILPEDRHHSGKQGWMLYSPVACYLVQLCIKPKLLQSSTHVIETHLIWANRFLFFLLKQQFPISSISSTWSINLYVNIQLKVSYTNLSKHLFGITVPFIFLWNCYPRYVMMKYYAVYQSRPVICLCCHGDQSSVGRAE